MEPWRVRQVSVVGQFSRRDEDERMTKEMMMILLVFQALLVVGAILGRIPVHGYIRESGWVSRTDNPRLFWSLWGFSFVGITILMLIPLIRGTLH